jgi:hypothetical protein
MITQGNRIACGNAYNLYSTIEWSYNLQIKANSHLSKKSTHEGRIAACGVKNTPNERN